MKYYPVCLNVAGKRCVVIGGGRVAERKVKRLLDCGAMVRVISPAVTTKLSGMAGKGRVSLKKKCVETKDIKGAYLVISAANDDKINSLVYDHCAKKNIPVNVVDSPDKCSFILPSVISKGELTISVSTGGTSPALSKKIRQDLEGKFGPEYAAFLSLMKKLRPEVMDGIKIPKRRKMFFEKAVNSDVLNLIKKKDRKNALKKLERMLRDERNFS